jgi:hypothetical protein
MNDKSDSTSGPETAENNNLVRACELLSRIVFSLTRLLHSSAELAHAGRDENHSLWALLLAHWGWQMQYQIPVLQPFHMDPSQTTLKLRRPLYATQSGGQIRPIQSRHHPHIKSDMILVSERLPSPKQSEATELPCLLPSRQRLLVPPARRRTHASQPPQLLLS